MSARDAATYLGYVAVFSAVVAWGFLVHGRQPEPLAFAGDAPSLAGSLSTNPEPILELRQVAASVR